MEKEVTKLSDVPGERITKYTCGHIRYEKLAPRSGVMIDTIPCMGCNVVADTIRQRGDVSWGEISSIVSALRKLDQTRLFMGQYYPI